jgi:transcriptional regulator with XRE-family HTH domain
VPLRRSPYPDWIRPRQQALGRRIADLRKAADLSQDQLADRAGMERRSIQRYENAVRTPRITDLWLIAEALDVPVADLLAEE